MNEIRRPLIGQILIEKWALTPLQIEEGLRAQQLQGGRIGEALIRLKYLTEGRLLPALSDQWKIPYLTSLDPKGIDPSFAAKVPIAFAKRNFFLPYKAEDGVIFVATSNPLALPELDDLRLLLSSPIEVVALPEEEVMKGIHSVYERVTDSAQEAISDFSGQDLSHLAEEIAEPEDLLDASDEAPMIRLVNAILFQAISQRASDIHFEPFERELVIRYRIDGVLYGILSPPKRLHASLISRIKIMAGMNIAEKRLPQDGRIGLKIAGRDIDLRVSDVPTPHGERLVLRILDKSDLLLNLHDIGLTREGLERMGHLITMPHGMLLVTGPTGSGKTTTLYTCLSEINSSDKNIITIEDPIEYQIKGIGQIQVNPKIELTFANGLRSILRQDPDVIMVGEIRDMETAQIAIHASLTGHLVFSTLHTNDAAGAITRLLDMEIEPFLVTSSVTAIVAQRLVRLICKTCRAPYVPTEEELSKLGLTKGQGQLYRGKGCPDCMNTGYRGRSGIYEILIIDDEVRGMILTRVDSMQIKTHALSKGMISLREDGARKILEGITTTEEVLRVTQDDLVA